MKRKNKSIQIGMVALATLFGGGNADVVKAAAPVQQHCTSPIWYGRSQRQKHTSAISRNRRMKKRKNNR